MMQQRLPSPDPHAARSPSLAGRHAMRVVLGVIAVSLCFGVLHVVDVAASGDVVPARLETKSPAIDTPQAPVATNADCPSTDDDGCAMNAVLVEVPSASAEAINL